MIPRSDGRPVARGCDKANILAASHLRVGRRSDVQPQRHGEGDSLLHGHQRAAQVQRRIQVGKL
jgi:hypothetical protein